MKVAKLVAIKKMELFEEEIHTPKTGEVLVKITAVGICGSDLHYFLKGGLGTFKENLPMSMGHEAAGVVVDSNDSQFFENGDRVAIEPGNPCLHCRFCQQGLHNLCREGTFLGTKGIPGAFREYLVLNERQLVKIKDDMSIEEACLLETMGIACHAYNLINFKFYSSVAIFGVGPIGLSILNIIKRAGAGKIFVIDKLEHRLKFALSHSADFAKKDGPDTIDFIRDNTEGLGVDVAFDAAGMQNTVDSCFKVAAPGGKVVLVGIPTYDYLQYNPHISRIKELSVFNVRRSNQTLHTCRDLFEAGDIVDMITHKFKLDNIQKAFDLAAEYGDGAIKTIITM